MDKNSEQIHSDEQPPVLNSWNKIYLVVLLFLVIQIIFFTFFTKVFE